MQYFPFGGGGGDVESGLLYPGQDSLDATLRWGFVRKVYGIIAAQLVLTAIVAAVVVANSDVRHFMLAHWGVQVSSWCAEHPAGCSRLHAAGCWLLTQPNLAPSCRLRC